MLNIEMHTQTTHKHRVFVLLSCTKVTECVFMMFVYTPICKMIASFKYTAGTAGAAEEIRVSMHDSQ